VLGRGPDMSRTVLGILSAAGQPEEPCILRRACEQARVAFQCESVTSAGEGVRYLDGRGPYGNRHRYPMPALVILDLALQDGGGYEVLSWIRREPRLQSLPVVVVSKSKSQMDMRRAYDLGASSYMPKPEGFAELVKLVKLIDRFWLTLNQAPRA
jgi:DNA-binding response OmpR family regulator